MSNSVSFSRLAFLVETEGLFCFYLFVKFYRKNFFDVAKILRV